MTNTTISAVTNLTIADISEPIEGVCQGTMDKHGFVLVGEEKFFLGLDVLQACGFLTDRFVDGRKIQFGWVPAHPSKKIAVVIAIDGVVGKANDATLQKALEPKRTPKQQQKGKDKRTPKPKAKGKPGKQVLRNATTIKPETIFPKEGDTFGAVLAKDEWNKGHIFVRGTMVFKPEEEGYFPLQEPETIRFGTPGEESKERLFVHISQIPEDREVLEAIMRGEAFAVQVIRDKTGRFAGTIIGMLGAPVEEPGHADNVVDLTKRTGTAG